MLPTAIRVKQTSFLWPYSLESGSRLFCLYFLLLLYASPSSLTALYSASPCSSQPQGLWPCHSPHLECSFIRYVYGGVSQVSAQMPRLQSPSLPPHPKTEPSSPACPSKLPSTESLGCLFHRIYHHLPRKETIFQKPRFWLLLFLYFFMSQPHRMFVCRGREFFCFIFNCDKTFLT